MKKEKICIDVGNDLRFCVIQKSGTHRSIVRYITALLAALLIAFVVLLSKGHLSYQTILDIINVFLGTL